MPDESNPRLAELQQQIETLSHRLEEEKRRTPLEARLGDLEKQVLEQGKQISRVKLRLPDVIAFTIWGFIVILVLVVLAYTLDDIRAVLVEDSADSTPAGQSTADEAVAAADRATQASSRVLNFMEGASLLIALMLGAAAIYGFRNAQEVRRDLRDEKEELTKLREGIERDQAALRDYVANQLNDASVQVQQARDLVERIHDYPTIFIDLTEAYQQIEARNYETAYDTVKRLLEIDPSNPAGQYIAGWLELQYIPDKLEQGIQRLEDAYAAPNRRLVVKAVYGVALRRKANKMLHPNERQQRLLEAEKILREVLREAPRLLDLNAESLWGPVGGIRRDVEDFDGAIEAYREACSVTPGSSYPHGNLAVLLLRRTQHTSPESAAYEQAEKEALSTFKKTADLAKAESLLAPHDYYHMMDIAMSRTILGFEETGNFSDAAEGLEQVLGFDVTAEQLIVSLRGWRNLHDFCPYQLDGEIRHGQWDDVYYHVKIAVLKVAWRLVAESIHETIERVEPYEQARQDVEAVLQPLLSDTPGAARFLSQFRLRLNSQLPLAEKEWQLLVNGCPYAAANERLKQVLALIQDAIRKVEQVGGENA